MHGDTEFLRRQLWRAVLRRRLPQWLAPLAVLIVPVLLLERASLWASAALLAWAFCLALDGYRWHQRVRREWSVWLDAAIPALEDSSMLLACAPTTALAKLQQQRLCVRLASVINDDDYRRIARSRVHFSVLPLLFSVVIAVASASWAYHARHVDAAAAPAARLSQQAIVDGEIYLRVTPPAYTGVQPYDSAARDIEVPQYTQVRWCVRNSGTLPEVQPVVELGDGSRLAVTPDCAMQKLDASLFWRVRGSNTTRYTIRVTPDQAPQVRISEPNELIHLLSSDAKTVQIAVSVRDDYAIVRASLHLTLARGSGENIRFSDREVPLPQSSDPKARNWSRQWQLAELGMEAGDELYFFVRATDNAPGNPHSTQSPTYTLRLPSAQAQSEDASTLPSLARPESLRSQRQIIIDTEQLVADMQARPGLAASTLRARSEAIAMDQASLRLRYGQFLGEESSLFGAEHEHEHEHEQEQQAKPVLGNAMAVLKEYGHAHDQEDNATIFDPATKALLKRALAAMWDAEKSLRALTPKTALAPEYKALEAIKALQAAERIYLHRTAFVAPALKEEKRMSGDIVGVLSYQRAQGKANDSVPAEVRALVQALAQDGTLPALWSKTARAAIDAGIADPEQKLSAQRALQDVQDGCQACRGVLRAWLRASLTEVPLLLQARPATDTPFERAWSGKEAQQ